MQLCRFNISVPNLLFFALIIESYLDVQLIKKIKQLLQRQGIAGGVLNALKQLRSVVIS